MSNFPKVLEQKWVMYNSDLNVVGEYLGYEWNQVREGIGDAEFYAKDGDGLFSVRKNKDSIYSKSEIANEIIKSIFDEYTEVDVIYIVNDF